MDRFTTTVANDEGQPIEDATVGIYTTGSGVLAVIYDDDESTPITNPLTTDENGFAEAMLANGKYDIRVAKGDMVKPVTQFVAYDPDDAVTGTSFNDSNFEVFDNGDNTKKVKLQASGISTATTRTLTVPNKDGTLALTSDVGGITNGGYLTGGYHFGGLAYANDGDSFALVANTPLVIPFVVGAQETFTRIGINVASGHASNIRMGIYNWANGRPTTLVLDAGTVSASSTGEKEITISQALAPGVYGLALVSNGTSSVYRGNPEAALSWHYSQNTAFYDSFTGCLDGSFSYAALPANASSFGLSANNASWPAMWLRKV